MEQTLYAGYSKMDITPDFPVCLSGYGNDSIRPAMGIESRIYVTCVAVKSGDKTFLIYTMDGLSAHESIPAILRERMAEVCDIPGEQIFLSATHCHSCPLIYLGVPGTEEYRELFFSQAVQAGLNAIADLSPATMELAQKTAPGFTFVRHFLMKDGTWAGINFGDFKLENVVDYATPADETMILLSFVRQGKKPILMVNFQAHAAWSYQIGRYIISADWIGHMRDTVTEKTDYLVAYYNGASGNQITADKLNKGPEELWFKHGRRCGEFVVEMTKELKPISGTQLGNAHLMYQTPIEHSTDHLVEPCKEIYDLYGKQGNMPEASRRAKEMGLSSAYVAAAIIRRSNHPAVEEREMNAFRIGPVGFTTGTYEMSSNEGIYVRKNSPFAHTFILCANSGYIPNSAAIDYHTYEGDTTMEARGTAEKMAQKYVEMLNSLC